MKQKRQDDITQMVEYPVAMEPIWDSAKHFSSPQQQAVFRNPPNSSGPEHKLETV